MSAGMAAKLVMPSVSPHLPGYSRIFFWNCNFNAAGKHLVNPLVRTTERSNVKRHALLKSYEIRVITRYRQYANHDCHCYRDSANAFAHADVQYASRCDFRGTELRF
jgi:hypothetical protein